VCVRACVMLVWWDASGFLFYFFNPYFCSLAPLDTVQGGDARVGQGESALDDMDVDPRVRRPSLESVWCSFWQGSPPPRACPSSACEASSSTQGSGPTPAMLNRSGMAIGLLHWQWNPKTFSRFLLDFLRLPERLPYVDRAISRLQAGDARTRKGIAATDQERETASAQ